MSRIANWRWLALAWALETACPRTGWAACLEVQIACANWTPETVAQVEARLRASLKLEDLDTRKISVRCEVDDFSVEVETSHGELRRLFHSSATREDDVVEAVEEALRELQGTQEVSQERTPPQCIPAEAFPAPLASPTPTHPPSPPPSSVASTPSSNPVRSELSATLVIERWPSNWSWGAEGGLSVGKGVFQYGVLLGGRTVSGEPARFQLSEWDAAVQLQLALPGLAGLRAGFAAGPSLLVVTPAAHVVADSVPLLVAWSAELNVTRPLWLGAVGFAPGLGLRWFGAQRQVRVNDQPQLRPPSLVPQASLSLIYARQ